MHIPFKRLNELVVSRHFKMEHLNMALTLVHQDCYLASIDLRHAYYSCPVKHRDRDLLQFEFEGTRYRYKVMPNGLCSAPRYFTRIMKAVTAFFRSRYNITLTAYLDDTLLVADTKEELAWAVGVVSTTLTALGFTIHGEKSVLVPTKKIQYLGVIIDSQLMRVTLPEGKTCNLIAKCQDTLQAGKLSIREVAGLIGMLQATRFANRHAALFLKVLEREKIKALAQARGNFDRHMRLSQKACADICWWIDNLPTMSKTLLPLTINETFYTDASLLGWGCFDPKSDTRYGETWDEHAQNHHINVLELMAVQNTLHTLASHLHHTHILIRTDNTTTKQCINKQGSTRSDDCNNVARDIWLFCIPRAIHLTAEYCPGVDNVEADTASRNFTDATEWSLHPDVFQQIWEKLGHTDIDFFASDENYKVKPYASKLPSVNAFSRDAFNCSWTNSNGFFFPPFCLASRVLRKMNYDKATGVIVLPRWPSQPWFTALMNLMPTTAYTISVEGHTLFLPHAPEKTHPLAGRLELIAARVSPLHSRHKACPTKFVGL